MKSMYKNFKRANIEITEYNLIIDATGWCIRDVHEDVKVEKIGDEYVVTAKRRHNLTLLDWFNGEDRYSEDLISKALDSEIELYKSMWGLSKTKKRRLKEGNI